uniref:Zona pellucida glycoprotein d n=2 Tax=Cyprinus carpio TaxID=7962 RepID=A0A8C1HSH8_CYPCA
MVLIGLRIVMCIYLNILCMNTMYNMLCKSMICFIMYFVYVCYFIYLLINYFFTSLLFIFFVGKCQDDQKNITHIPYSLTLMSDPPIEYKCIYPYISRLSLAFPIISFSRLDEVDAMVEMSLYKDHTYAEAFTSYPFKLGDQIYVEIQVTEPEDFFHLRVNECWATQTPQANDKSGFSHTLLLRTNGEGSTVRYSLDMFRYVSTSTVHLCTPEDGKSYIPECKTVSKREVVIDEQAQGLLSYGPVSRELPVRSMISMFISPLLPLAVIWTLGIFLFILMSIVKAGN